MIKTDNGLTLSGSESLKELIPTQYANSWPNSLSIHARKRLTRGKLECALGKTKWCAATAALSDSGATSTSVPAAKYFSASNVLSSAKPKP